MATVALSLLLGWAPSSAEAAFVDPSTGDVTADALPTTQIDGVVWVQRVLGDTVYAGGSFSTARPAGAGPGKRTVPRSNLLAYSISTGLLNTSFAPTVNAQIKAMAISPDGTRLYVGGSFTLVNGVNRYRIAAFNLRTGALLKSFSPQVNSAVRSIVATDTTVYVGGEFSLANGVSRTRLAAFRASDGAVTSWNPSANDDVNALVVTPDRSRVIVGGAFTTVGGRSAYGLAAVGASTGALLTWKAGNTIRDAGESAAILSLYTDGTSVFGTGYVFDSTTGNFEGTFSADPDSGKLNWLEDCHGDTYGAFVSGGQVYTVSHAHFCGNIGGFGETLPRTYHRAVAFTNRATGAETTDAYGGRYTSFTGQPCPSVVDWFPDLAVGKVTGQHQAAWSITGNSTYVVLGGEFPSVNGVDQQGLVRFATKPTAPSLSGPVARGASFVPRATPTSTTSMVLSWIANWDRDNAKLTYSVSENGDDSHPIYTATAVSTFWDRPAMSVTESHLTPGTTYRYRLFATDPSGNKVGGKTINYTAPTSIDTYMAYAKSVFAAGARTYYPFDQPAGVAPQDVVGFDDGVLTGSTTKLVSGAVPGDGSIKLTQPGTVMAEQLVLPSPPTRYSVQIWINSSSTSGGSIMGYGQGQGASTTLHDRQLYMRPDGRVSFTITNRGHTALVSPKAINDGRWHQLTATEGSAGSILFVDGVQVASSPTRSQSSDTFPGEWRIGAEKLKGYPSAPSSAGLVGGVDEVAIYPKALAASVVRSQYAIATDTVTPLNPPPSGSYASTVMGDGPSLYWRLDDTGSPSGLGLYVDGSPQTTNSHGAGQNFNGF